ncbi:flagellar basal-body rod protein FlgF [Phenylobacterium soli]|uniref:Flagellar basal-body rod protein FlgF n=1 Tax=Phenylobacterium soli TaxID=2170551 RepID=A0A328AIK9_9CAUL|nr:flagellar basal-body rod protein FlgF [Phenylobacterium soli]RAK54662.1 flagellar basal-body rod protein FlgF [Phenylobacterium soli]
MDNSLYVGLSKQMVLQRQLDIIANNIANADTSGFKVEALAVAEDPQAPAFTLGGPAPVKFVMPNGVIRDFGQGSLRKTDAALDVAIEGQGFFKVQTPAGERYTRDGRFRTDEAGRLVTQGGSPVLDDGGGEISLSAEKGQVTISTDGTISQGAERIGKLGVYTFANLSTLEKTGDNLLQNTSNQPATAATDAKLRQGMLEGSNVNPILEITRMIEVSRAYEQMAKMMDSQGDLSTQAIQQLGKAA